MTTIDLSYLPLTVINVGKGGKRSFDPDDKRRLIQACLQPGVSISGMALMAGINANQLHKWIMRYKRTSSSAFVPVVTAGNASELPPVSPYSAVSTGPEMESPSPMPPRPARLSARLPNGARVEFECGEHDATLVRALVEALGAS